MGDSAVEIGNVLATYAELMDGGDFAGIGALFSDAVLGALGGPTVQGRDAISELFRSMVKIHADGTPRTKHVTTNIQADVEDDSGTATVRSYFTVLQATDELPLQPIVAGRYHDRFARLVGRWRLVERRFCIDLVGDVSQHLLGGPAVLDSPGPQAR